MIKVGDKVRILENRAGSLRLHYFHVGDIVKVTYVQDENNIIAIGRCGNNDEWEQLLVNTENLKQFEKVTDMKEEE